MFVRIAEFTVRSNARCEFVRLVNSDLVPMVRRQPGLIDAAILVSDEGRNLELAVTFWRSRHDAERFYCKEFSDLHHRFGAYLSDDIKFSSYNVDASTCHRFFLRRAA